MKKIFGELLQGINYVTITEDNLEDLISNIETPAFGYEKKLILIRNTGLFQKNSKKNSHVIKELKEKIEAYFVETIDNINLYNVIIFIEENAEKNSFYSWMEKNGRICAFEKQTPLQLKTRLKAIYAAYEVTIEDSTLQYLIETCGTSMQELVNESRKVIEYAGKGGKVTKENIDLLCMKEVNAVIFTLTDALGKRKITEAIQTLQNLLYNKEPLQKIVVTLYNHFKKLYFIKWAMEEKKDIAFVLKLKPNQIFLINKYKKQAEYFTKEELRNILEAIILLDKNAKVGLMDLNLGLEAILANYCS